MTFRVIERKRFLFVNVGYNFRPMEVQGAMGRVQLKKLDEKKNFYIFNFNWYFFWNVSRNSNGGYVWVLFWWRRIWVIRRN